MARPLFGYPQPNTAKVESVIDHLGPSSYASVSTGTPPTGGDTVNASEFGMKYFDQVLVAGSDNGQYAGVAFLTGGKNGQSTTAVLMWTTAATGAQVSAATNLSARALRLRAIGN